MQKRINTKRTLALRTYQLPASNFAMDNDIAILGVAPNGGKTEISIDVLTRFLTLNPNGKVLILTHSTNVLKDNYTSRLDELDIPYNYSTTFDPNCHVHVCLPNSEHLIKGTYDLLIVDEAHENYLAERVQRIIKKVSPQKQLLLTGTPSKFIKIGGYNIYTLAANQIPEEYFAKLQVELVASNYNWAKELNGDYEIKATYKFNKKETEKTLESILLKLIDRLRKGLSAEEFNNPNLIAKLKSWAYTYKKLGKTIIVCRSIKQAGDVNNILISNGVNSMVSDSETDPDSSVIAKFKDNQYDVLVVVDRARLGYSDDNLYNIIDMSGSHNPNVLYQIFARVLRGNPEMQKYYLKVTTQEYGMMDFTHACVSAALMLTDNQYLSTFNGNNFNGIKIPVIKKPIKTNTGTGVSSVGNPNKPKRKLIFPEFTNDVIDMFKNIIHNLDEPVSIYKLTTLGEVRAILSDRNLWTDEELIEEAKKYIKISHWEKGTPGAFKAAKNRGVDFFDNCCLHMEEKPHRWLDEDLIADAKKYKTKIEWDKASTKAYEAAKTRGNIFFERCCQHMVKQQKNNDPYSKEECKKIALNYTTKNEWRKASTGSYSKALRKGWLDECCEHMVVIQKPDNYWTKENCIQDAQQYKNNGEWMKNSEYAYKKALENGWLDECRAHMKIRKPNGYWKIKEHCIEEAKKYTTKFEWEKANQSSLNSARNNGWLDECCLHMKK